MAFLVDLDGVLVHSHGLHLAAYERALAARGLELDDSARSLVTGGAARERVLERAGVPESLMEEVSEAKEAAFLDLLDEGGLEPVPGADAFLRALADAGCPAVLVSNSATAERCVEALGFDWAFRGVVGPDAVARTKPDPEPFLKAASLVGADPRSCVAVEDSPTGAAAARAAGAFVVGVGGRVPLDQADRLVDELADIPVRRWLAAPSRQEVAP